ncbi:MAG: phosphatase PAP2 family protein [Acidobacteria bacterium]|nr:phosphatase PAP2 family protein [Acidobacteriota bacterium]
MKRFLLFGVLFGVCYSGASWLAMQRASLPSWAFPFEQHVPFVPWMAYVYLTIIPALLVAPLLLRDELRAFATTLCWETVIACAFFVVYPLTTSFHRPPVSMLAFRVADALNLEANEFPSLHVAFAVTCAWVYGRRRRGVILSPAEGEGSPRKSQEILRFAQDDKRTVFWITWCVLVSASAWLTWEHQLIDLLGGAVLAWACIQREIVWAELCCLVQCARFSRRHVRYFVIFLAIWGPSLLHWRRTRVIRFAFVTAQWIDDLLDGDRPSKRDPLLIVDELLARRFTREPLPRLMAALFRELKPQDEFLDLIREMRLDRLRLGERWTAAPLEEHHRRTFALSVDLMLQLTGCRTRATEVMPLVDALAWCSVFRDLDDDLAKGLINIPLEVTDAEAWSRDEHARALRTLRESENAIAALSDRKAQRILGVFQRSIEKFAAGRLENREAVSTAQDGRPAVP